MSTTTAYPALDKETDSDLLCQIGMVGEDRRGADDAFVEFHRRHAPYLFRRLEKWVFDLGDQRRRAVDHEALASETLIKSYEEAASYKDRSGGDRELGELQVRAWLFKIATRLVLDELRKPAIRLIKELADELPDIEVAEDLDPPPVSNATSSLIARSFGDLSDVDQDILTTCVAYGAYGDNADALPAEVRKKLMAQHGLTDVTFRQRKSRALKKLRDGLS